MNKPLMFLTWIFCCGSLIAQKVSHDPLASYPVESQKQKFIQKVWLKNSNWQLATNNTGKQWFLSRDDAKSADIRIVPILTPSLARIDAYDSTKNILDFLQPDLKACNIAYIVKKGKPAGLLESCKGFTTVFEGFDRSEERDIFQKPFIDQKPVYYDNVFRLYCYIEQGRSFIYEPFEKRWLPFEEFMNGQVSYYARKAKERK